MDTLTTLVSSAGGFVWQGMFVVLLLVGLYLTLRTGAIQFRAIPEMFRVVGEPGGRGPDGRKQISSFRAFTISAAARVGTGNIAGVAIAISAGGPGSVFWMWLMAAIGGASAFVESLLAQLYKHQGRDAYVGGPAYYMQRGLRARWMGVIFAVIICITYGFAFNSVQSNSIVDAVSQSTAFVSPDLAESFGLKVAIGLLLVVCAALVIFGGVRSISAVSQVVVPVMAVLYVLLGLTVVVLNLGEVPAMVVQIIEGAFGIREFVVGGLMGVIITGMQRGLFSNEAGMGSAPNAGATAAVSHPAKQGLVQSLGVYFDTMIICSITAFIVLLSNPTFGDETQGASLTQNALSAQLGDWALHFLTVAIFLFAFTSLIGNYYYGESNIQFLTKSTLVLQVYRLLVLLCVFAGAVIALDLAWAAADLFMAFMAFINLVAIALLAGVAVKVMKHYQRQRKAGEEPIFHASDLPELTGIEVWDGNDEVTTRQFWVQHFAGKEKQKARR
ncbi:alanine:cation symporter family protein [Rothia sp. AR01]|uniref:Alanine:cation symporter family protein n=1 Tax=Rothia santali TaxID=2949643 RepID=A0A9X2H9V3_9MICC|nr:alanine/glycine:cation symporter family protein [Rothia santali]MCP3425669.1 alanine:cation symporter family protein [Rothia santali]